MSVDPDNGGVLGRWARRKADVKRQSQEAEAAAQDEGTVPSPQIEPATEEEALEVLRERDPELAERIASIDIDKLAYEDDFSVFMNTKVPEFIRRRALSKLWLLSPVLANLDGLNDYDNDFTDAATVLKDFKSAYMPGRGYAIAEDPEDAEETEELLADEDAIPDSAPQVAKADDEAQADPDQAAQSGADDDDDDVEVGDGDIERV